MTSSFTRGLSIEKELRIFSSPWAYMTTRTSLPSVFRPWPFYREGSRNFSQSPGFYRRKSSEFFQVLEAHMTTRTRAFCKRGARKFSKSLGLYRVKSPDCFQVPKELGIFVSLMAYNIVFYISSYFRHIPPWKFSKSQNLYIGQSSVFFQVSEPTYIGGRLEIFSSPITYIYIMPEPGTFLRLIAFIEGKPQNLFKSQDLYTRIGESFEFWHVSCFMPR